MVAKVYYISPEELFFLGKMMEARYLDYEYIKMLPDMQNDIRWIRLAEKEAIRSLSRKQYLKEYFSGKTEIEEGLKSLLECLFERSFIADIYMVELGELQKEQRHKYHFYADRVAKVGIQNKELTLTSVGKGYLREWKNNVFGEYHNTRDEELEWQESMKPQVSHMLQLRSISIGQSAFSYQLIKMGEYWYQVEKNEVLKMLQEDHLEKLWMEILQEEKQDGIL